MNILQKTSSLLLGAFLLAAVPMATANAAHVPTYYYKGNIRPLNRSSVSGKITVKVVGDQATVIIKSKRMSAMLPHAQHLHIGGKTTCPAPGLADTNKDRFVSTVEGIPFYGGIGVSLTTDGDVSPASALALDRFPVANAKGMVTYERTFTLPEGITGEDLADATLIQHGIAKLFDNKNEYDGAKRSSLTDAVPFEVTVAAACAPLR